MIASTQITSTEIFAFIAALVFQLLSRKVSCINFSFLKFDIYLPHSQNRFKEIVSPYTFLMHLSALRPNSISGFGCIFPD